MKLQNSSFFFQVYIFIEHRQHKKKVAGVKWESNKKETVRNEEDREKKPFARGFKKSIKTKTVSKKRNGTSKVEKKKYTTHTQAQAHPQKTSKQKKTAKNLQKNSKATIWDVSRIYSNRAAAKDKTN